MKRHLVLCCLVSLVLVSAAPRFRLMRAQRQGSQAGSSNRFKDCAPMDVCMFGVCRWTQQPHPHAKSNCVLVNSNCLCPKGAQCLKTGSITPFSSTLVYNYRCYARHNTSLPLHHSTSRLPSTSTTTR